MSKRTSGLRAIQGGRRRGGFPTDRDTPRGELQGVDPVSIPDGSDLEPHWLPSYVRGRPLNENVFSLARPLWGKAASEWAWLLSDDVVDRIPSAASTRAAPGWTAGILCVTAVEVDMDRNPALWNHILDDITAMTGVSRQTALRRWRELVRAGLTRPSNEPEWWRDGDA